MEHKKHKTFYYPCESSTNNAQNEPETIEHSETTTRQLESSLIESKSEHILTYEDTSFCSSMVEAYPDNDTEIIDTLASQACETQEYHAPRCSMGLSTINERLEMEALQEEMETMKLLHAEQEDLHVRTIEELEAKLAASENLVQQLKQENDDERATWKKELNTIKAQVSSLLDKKSNDSMWKEQIEIQMEELGRQLLDLQNPPDRSGVEFIRGVGLPGVISEGDMSEVDSNDSGELDNRDDNSDNNDWKMIPDDWWTENGFSKCTPCQRWYKRMDLHNCHGRPTTRKINDDNKLAASLKAVSAWSWEP